MTRSANQTPPSSPGVVLVFKPREIRALHHNTPGPSGVLGGYAKEENYLVANTDRKGRCVLDSKHFERVVRYCRKYGDGGPNRRIREACIPALGRVGIIIEPESGE